MSESSEFPRPCKNCGNQVTMHNGKLVHVYRKSVRCRISRAWDIERDSQGMPTALHSTGYYPIPDPVSQRQRDEQRLKEWNEIYRNQRGPASVIHD
jgi:hypothetical protein